MALAVAIGGGTAFGQLRPEEVLVVYDSRIASSRDVAEYYAGSKKVPGGAGNLNGKRPGVRVVDLAALGAVQTVGPDISHTDFIARLRNPLRSYLSAQGLSQGVRCLVTTKGLPHRILDTDNPAAGDNPLQLIDEYNASDPTMASVDTELMLLWQDLTAGEAGGPADSRADGVIVNPFWRSQNPIRFTPQTNIEFTARTYTVSTPGPTWSPSGTLGSPQRLGPGDIYLVCRLDGNSVADVQALLDRAQSIMYDTLNHAAVLDESASDGIANPGANDEFDNSASGFPALRDADDYETTRDELLADTRFAPAFTRYNALSGGSQFLIGPRYTWQPPVILVNEPVVLIAHYGTNHSGQPLTSPGGLNSRTFWATSYNMPNGTIINSMESYNCRAFGGLGQNAFAPQQQVADYLAAGGTFGVGNCWEPLADSVPDTRYLARNFVRGEMSWAEAAWSSIPAISWQQMAIGDPLARAARTSEDIAANGRIGVDDLYAWEAAPTDVNRNGTTDAADRAFVVRAIRGWERADLLTARR